MTTPTQDSVAQRAYQIWQREGCPDGRDTEMWLVAERQLAEEMAPSTNAGDANGSRTPANSEGPTATTRRLKAEMAAESVIENHISPAISEEEAIKAALQKHEAREPITAHTSAPRAKPPESGKPLWSRPHSS